MTARRIGILGGTFDPAHCGHTDIACAAQDAFGLTPLYVMPAQIPPHRQPPIASSYHRFAMVALAVANRSGWIASDLELQSPATTSYTAHTLRTFHDGGYRPSELFFIIGADAFADVASWFDYPRILDAAHFTVVSRPGFPVGCLRDRLPDLSSRMTSEIHVRDSHDRTMIFLLDARTADVSATAIRDRVARGLSIAGMVPPAVQQHIEQHGLYTSSPPAAGSREATDRPAAGRLHGQD